MRPKKPPKKYAWNPKNNTLYRVMSSIPGVILINWVFQGMLGMAKSELIFHLAFDLIVTLIFLFLFSLLGFAIPYSIVIGFFLAHTTNWLLNTMFWSTLRFVGILNNPSKIRPYMKHLTFASRDKSFLKGAVVIGSPARNEELRPTSDLDVRFIRETGFLNAIKANLFHLKERARSFVLKVPLDSYMHDNMESLDKLREDEIPIILYDPKGLLQEKYCDKKIILMDDLELL